MRIGKFPNAPYIKSMVVKPNNLESLNDPSSTAEETANNIRWLAGKALSGFVFSIFFVAMLLAFNIANLRHLILNSEVGLTALFILTFFLGLTFGSIQMGIAIMNRANGKDDDNDQSGRGPKLPDIAAYIEALLAPAPQPKPIRVRSKYRY